MYKTLSSVIDFVNESTFYNCPIPASEAKRIVSFIADRQGKPGAYAHTFAPVGNEMERYRLFTGETPGLAALKTYRDGMGGWSGFPFLPAPIPGAGMTLSDVCWKLFEAGSGLRVSLQEELVAPSYAAFNFLK
ncbi:MAG: hypothetical protein V1913_10090 [Fibrobacterota bacterium]